MAKTLTALDAHAIMNLIQSEALGASALANVDSSNFVSVGESVMATGIENTLNALTMAFTTVVAIRPYSAKLNILQEETSGLYSSRVNKISFYDKGSKESGWMNTQSHTNIYDGYDNGTNGGASVGSQWEIDKPVAIQFSFGGRNIYDFCLTLLESQLKMAFTSEAAFLEFWNGTMLAKQNEINQFKEDQNRLTLVNYVGGLYDMNTAGTVVDLVAGYNAKFNTNYTGDDLRTTYLSSFLAYMVAEIKKHQKYLTERSCAYHWNPSITRDGTVYDKLPRVTEIKDQKLIMNENLIMDAEALVLPQIFHDEALRMTNYEGVTFWQSQQNRNAIDVTPAIPNTADPSAQTIGARVQLPYVVAVLFDKDACITNFQTVMTDSTEKEARKKYRNIWTSVAFNSVNDFTMNGILFYMAS